MAARQLRVLVLSGLVLVVGLGLSGCGRSEPAGTADGAATTASTTAADPYIPATQTVEEGGVTVMVTWPGPSAGPVFDVVMDTHSVDLDAYDLQELAVLRNDQGREAQPTGWDAPKGEHHREGTLSFPEVSADGSELISQNTRKVELVIHDVAGVSERTFEWTL